MYDLQMKFFFYETVGTSPCCLYIKGKEKVLQREGGRESERGTEGGREGEGERSIQASLVSELLLESTYHLPRKLALSIGQMTFPKAHLHSFLQPSQVLCACRGWVG